MKLEHGGYVFEGNVEVEGSYYARGNFISQDKIIKSQNESIILRF